MSLETSNVEAIIRMLQILYRRRRTIFLSFFFLRFVLFPFLLFFFFLLYLEHVRNRETGIGSSEAKAITLLLHAHQLLIHVPSSEPRISQRSCQLS